MTEVCQLEELVCMAEEVSEAHCTARVRVDDLTAERASLTVGTEQAMAECDTLVTRIRSWRLLQ